MGKSYCSLLNSQSQWIVGAFTSHQSAVTCKRNKKTTVVFRRPSDGKISFFFSGRLRVRAAVFSVKNVVPDLVLFFSLWRKGIHLSWRVDNFFP